MEYVLAFEYDDINTRDTYGYNDFSKDTFRALTVINSIIIEIDVAKVSHLILIKKYSVPIRT